MSDERGWRDTERAEPVGEPVVRADPAVTGAHAERAVEFDPEDPESLELAAETVREFATGGLGAENVYLLRGAAACAALVRGVGSYKAATERAGGEATVGFIRKWARVHDLPQSVRRHVARGNIAPTAAKHIARVRGEARFTLAWAAIDGDLTVREVRRVASAVSDGSSVDDALDDVGVDLGEITLSLPVDVYVELRRRASMRDVEPAAVVEEALAAQFDRTTE